MRKISLFMVLLILCSLSVVGATIQGTIYDLGLDIVKDVKVEINTEPKQMLIAKTGEYSFNVPKGNYIIQAEYEDLETIEKITVSAEGIFTLDLIMLPLFEEELIGEEDLGLEDYDVLFEENIIDKTILIVIIILSILTVIGVAIFIKKRKKKEKQKKKIMKEDRDRVIDFLKKEGGRALQKDIRKHLAISEAKASLLIDELKAKNKIEKIKKGRGNIIILK